jgi:Na+-driven multidrug efflux pump
MTNLLIVLAVLFVVLVVVVPLIERFAKPTTPEAMQKYHKIFGVLLGVMMLALVIRYFLENN